MSLALKVDSLPTEPPGTCQVNLGKMSISLRVFKSFSEYFPIPCVSLGEDNYFKFLLVT